MPEIPFSPRNGGRMANPRPDGAPRGTLEILPNLLFLIVPTDPGIGDAERYFDFASLPVAKRNALADDGEVEITDAELTAGLSASPVPMPAVLSARWASRAEEFEAFDEWRRARLIAQAIPGAPNRLVERAGRAAPSERAALIIEAQSRAMTMNSDIANANAAAESAHQNYLLKRPAQAGAAVPNARK